MIGNARFLATISIMVLSSIGCENNPIVDDPQVIPLDGRGGGVIAYTLQPGSGSEIHEIYAMNADGSANTQIAQAQIGLNHHDWSPDGEKLAAAGYVSETTASVYVFDADGGNLTRLTDTPNVRDTEPTWSPDGSSIAFTRFYPSDNDRTELWTMNADGSDQHWIGVVGFAARWSPDGRRFIYASDLRGASDIHSCNLDGTYIQHLTSTPSRDSTPIWSADGSAIAFTSDRDGDSEIYLMDADGSNVRRLTDNGVGDYAPKWSPDGSLIAFGSDATGNEHWEVHVIDADGTNLRRVTETTAPATAINPVWRPDPALSGPLLIIEQGTPVTMDGAMAASEWADAASVRYPIQDRVNAEVLFKHDGTNLLLAFICDRTNSRGFCHPEVYLDIDNGKSLTWQSDDWWFHVSAQDCDMRGTYEGDNTACSLNKPDWQAEPDPGAPYYPPLDTMEIRIPFAKIGSILGSRIGIAFNIHYHEGADLTLFGVWPANAMVEHPQTWGSAEIR